MNEFQRGVVNEIRLHVLPTDRFKTFAISAFIGQPLTEDQVTPNALIPFVLRRGTAKLPETKQFREHLDTLYGAGFGFDVYKRGDNQLIHFRMDIINDEFVSEKVSLLKSALDFLCEVLTEPVIDEGHFRPKYVDTEKNTLRKKLEAIINDKIRYAAERTIEEMCQDEPFRLHPLGRIAALESITPQSLYLDYVKWITAAPIDLYVVGDTSLNEVQTLIEQAFQVRRSQGTIYSNISIHPDVKEVKTVVERMDVNQGKLNLGLRTYTTYSDAAYPDLLMYNGIFGGYPHSKLFINVREKESLAYYASSRLDGHKGILTIQSGIEIANYDQAVAIIKEQLDSMAQGSISELEMSQTQAMITNQLQEIEDSAFEMISFDFNNVLSGKKRTIKGLISDIQDVDVSAIQRAAVLIKLDTIYFLTNRKGD